MASIISAQGALDQMVGLPSVTKLAAKAQLDKAREEYLAGVIDDAGLRSKVNQIIFTPEQAEARQPDGSVKLVAVAESPYAIWRTIKGDEASDAQAAAKLEADRNAAAISGVNRRVIEETAPSQIQAGRLAGPQAAATLEATQAGTAATLAQGQREAKATAFDKASLIPSLVNKGFAGEQARYRTLRTPSDLRIAARQVVEQYETFAKNPSLSGIGASFTPEDVITSWRSLVGPNLDPTVAHEVEQAIRGSLAYRGIGGAMAAPRTPTRTAGPPPATPQVPYGPPALAGSLGR